METDYIQLPPMPSDTPTELVAIVWIYVKMEAPEKVQILDFHMKTSNMAQMRARKKN